MTTKFKTHINQSDQALPKQTGLNNATIRKQWV